MSAFDPTVPAIVYDELNNELFPWNPEWAADYLEDAQDHGDGVVNWDGLLLKGWLPEEEVPALGIGASGPVTH